MTTDTDALVRTALDVIGVDAIFDRSLDTLMEKLKDALGIGVASPHSGGSAGPSGLSALREQLAGFRSEHASIYHDLLLKHLGPDQLEACVEALASAPVRRYFAAATAMLPELEKGMLVLGHHLTKIAFADEAE